MQLAVRISFAPLLLAAATLISCSDEAPPDESIGSTTEGWRAQSATDEGASTHLWIVDRALAGLGAQSDAAAHVTGFLRQPACKAQWQQGLLDPDFLAIYNDGKRDTKPGDSTATNVASGSTWASHFYDPDTQKNHEGDTTPTGRTRAAQFLAQADAAFAAGTPDSGCYAIGLALHYATDATQPMHTSNFTAKDRALLLHSNIEAYSVTLQERSALPAPFAKVPSYATADDAFVAGARASKALWPATLSSIYAAYLAGGFTCRVAYQTWTVDRASCWQGNAGVDAQIGLSLTTAQTSTAAYLLTLSAHLPPLP